MTDDTEKTGALPIWTHQNTPREFFLGMAGLIGVGIVIQVTNFQFIPAILIFALLPLAVFWGARMLYQNREHYAFKALAVATGVTTFVAVVLGISLLTSVGDPIPVDDGTENYCENIGLTTDESGYCVGVYEGHD